ncbi:MAG: type II secretion system F family protein [Desulfocucumaceae bacterium]
MNGFLSSYVTSLAVLLAAFLIAVSVFLAVTGNKLRFTRKRSVRLSDERIDTREKPGKSSQDMIVTAAGGVALGGVALAITGTWYFGLLGLAGGSLVLKWWKNRQEEERMELLRTQFIEVLGQLESATYGGMNPYQAMEDAVPNMPRPARDVFYEILRRTRTGDTLAQAIEAVRVETGWEDIKSLSIAIRLYNRVGVDLAETCRHSMEAYEDRESFRSIVAAAVAQNMMTLKVLTVLPFAFVGLARLMAPGFTDPLFNTFEGNVVFAVSAMWIIYGNVFTRRLVKKSLGQGV